MKKSITLLATILAVLQTMAQTTITLQPSATIGKDAHVDDLNPNSNAGTYAYVNAGYNTVGGTPTLSHDFLQFDLSAIPTGATVVSAELSLFHANGNNHSNSTANEELYALALSAWNEDLLTWNNQPALSTTDTIHIGNTNTSTESKPGINITSFVQQWVNNPAANFGMAMHLVDEPGALGRFQSYGSSDNADSAARPKLVITYIACNGHTVLQPGADGKDAHVDDLNANSNAGSYPYINAGYNTVGGIPTLSHDFLQFDLSSIPSGATVTSAKLSLYHANGNNHSNSTANEEIYALALSAWDENLITWNNQPALSAADTIEIGNTNSFTDNKTDINVAAFVQYWVNNPAMNFGMAMRLLDEPGSLGRFQSYGSGDNADSTVRPLLVIDWVSCATAINEQEPTEENFVLYPNPVNDILNIRTVAQQPVDVMVFDISGRKVLSANQVNAIGTSALQPGVYLITITAKGKTTTSRFVKN